MEKLIKNMERYLLPMGAALANIRVLMALKDGSIYGLPFLIVGSVLLLLLNLPITDPETFLYSQWYVDLMAKYKADWLQPYNASMGIACIFISLGFGCALSRYYGVPEIPGGILTLFTFLLMAGPIDGWPPVMNVSYMDGKGIFVALISGILAVAVYKFCITKKITIRLPESVPPNVFRSFEAITPVILIIIIVQPLNIFLASTEFKLLPELILQAFAPLVSASDSLPAVLFVVFLIHILWFSGIHGSNVVIAVVSTFTLSNLAVNQAAFLAGEELTRIWAGGFLDSYMYIGGSGSTLGLAVAMAISKNQQLKSIGKVSIAPGIFNINEPIIFGTPIIFNPIMGIPFICIPLINTTIAYLMLEYTSIHRVIALVPWTTPSPLAAFLSSNASLGALALSLSLLVLATLMYLPFLRVYSQSLEMKQKQDQEEKAAS